MSGLVRLRALEVHELGLALMDFVFVYNLPRNHILRTNVCINWNNPENTRKHFNTLWHSYEKNPKISVTYLESMQRFGLKSKWIGFSF